MSLIPIIYGETFELSRQDVKEIVQKDNLVYIYLVANADLESHIITMLSIEEVEALLGE